MCASLVRNGREEDQRPTVDPIPPIPTPVLGLQQEESERVVAQEVVDQCEREGRGRVFIVCVRAREGVKGSGVIHEVSHQRPT